MKTHYCKADKAVISYEGECNWCGEKENGMKEEALELADFLEKNMVASVAILGDVTATHIVSTIRRLVEELDNKQQGLIEASGMLFNYKYELDLERAMSAQLKEELDKHK